MYDNDTFAHLGHTFRFRTEVDDHNEAPWDREDGHGPVSDWTSRDKLPGERVLNSDHSSYRYYDFAAAVKLAKLDGWGHPDPAFKGTRGQAAAAAVEADFKRLRDWCNDGWNYIGVVVELLDDEDEPTGESESLWGIESDSDEYAEQVAHELAEQIIHGLQSVAQISAAYDPVV